MPLEIKHVKLGDESLFARVAHDVFDHEMDAKCVARFLAEPNHHLIVALHDGEIIGQLAAVVHRHPDLRPTELYIDEVAVSVGFRRRGIARQMLDAMFALGRSLGCAEAWVGTERGNAAAGNLYSSRGARAEDFAMYVFKL